MLREKLTKTAKLAKDSTELLKLPLVAIREVIKKTQGDTADLLRSIQIADHESGHLLISMLNGRKTSQVWRTRLPIEVARILKIPAGFVTDIKAPVILLSDYLYKALEIIYGEIEIQDVSENSRYSEIAKKIVELIAGVVADYTQYPHTRNFEDLFNKYRELSKKSVCSDFARIGKIVNNLDHLKDNEKDLTLEIFKDTIEFFDSEEVKKAIEIFSNELLERGEISDNRKDITPQMIELLKENGIDEELYHKIEEQYAGLIDKVTDRIRRKQVSS